MDFDNESRTKPNPIEGLDETPLVSLDEAIKPLVDIVQDVHEMVSDARRKIRSRSNIQTERDLYGITPDESDSIAAYTLENGSNSLYSALNQTLRIGTPTNIKPWLHFLKLLITTCEKLPSKECAVWRGIEGDVSSEYVAGESCVWPGFGSCTKNIAVAQRFLGDRPPVTVFMIQCIKGKYIQPFSLHKRENEILLLPGTHLIVEGKLEVSPDVWIIHLQEVAPPNYVLSVRSPERHFTSKLIRRRSKELLKYLRRISSHPRRRRQ